MDRTIVYVAMSGGVDSSVAAALLGQRGFEVRGVFMRYWGDVDGLVPGGKDFTNCCNLDAMNDAQRVCDHLGIPLTVMDLREQFRQNVVKPFLVGYESGLTPNPCVECNRTIKFELIDRILSEAAEAEKESIYFATGHYVRNFQFPIPNSQFRQRLFVAQDPHKDQSYFLYTLTQEKLKRLLFPIGEFAKPQVRTLAQEMELPVALKKESQEVCFIKNNVQEFLQSRIRQQSEGVVVTTTGEEIGRHRGLAFYTIGQREGLGLGGGGPYYVAQKDYVTNTLVVSIGAEDKTLFARTVILSKVNWLSGQPPPEPIRVIAKPRYRHPGATAVVSGSRGQSPPGRGPAEAGVPGASAQTIICTFDQPERALTSGQSVVFYQDTAEGLELLGGGIIEMVER
ncbi:tRNA 2-thiouridine(34) synthase MnmA [Candidatus Uhrbacteria bacterium]|nr:tRNA 2-thiouridine(34) synthase MnmA [Candidatus Uhrbacteria bacterium]